MMMAIGVAIGNCSVLVCLSGLGTQQQHVRPSWVAAARQFGGRSAWLARQRGTRAPQQTEDSRLADMGRRVQ